MTAAHSAPASWTPNGYDPNYCDRCRMHRDAHGSSLACPVTPRVRKPGNPAGRWAASAVGCVLVSVISVIVMAAVASNAALCASDLGQLGQAFDSAAAQQCGLFEMAHTLSVILFVLGILGTVGSIAMYARGTSHD